MKRILCILDSLNAGGAETFMMKIYRGIDRNKYQLDFIVCEEGIYDQEVMSLGGKIYSIPLRTKKFWGAMKSIYNIVRENKYCTVIKLGSSPIVLPDLIMAKLGGAKKVCLRSCNAPNNLTKKQRFIDAILRPTMNRITDVKISPSDLAAKYTFGEKCVQNNEVIYLHNAVDLKLFEFCEEKRRLVRSELYIKDDSFVVGHVGRFVNQKNHDFLIDIFCEIKKKHENAVLLLVGDGELKNAIRKKVVLNNLKDSVVFMGVRSDIPNILSAMDVLVLPSFYEGMPNSVIEAQATGLPCLVSDSITKEVNVTNCVDFFSLEKSAKEWANKVDQLKIINRKGIGEIMKEKGYSIEDSIKLFCAII